MFDVTQNLQQAFNSPLQPQVYVDSHSSEIQHHLVDDELASKIESLLERGQIDERRAAKGKRKTGWFEEAAENDYQPNGRFNQQLGYNYFAGTNQPGLKNKKPVYAPINQQTVNGLLSLLFLFLLAICGCIGNIFIISSLTVVESLQVRGNCYLVSLALAHLIINLLVIPSSALQIMAGESGINQKRFCHYQWLLLEFSLIVTQLTFFLISLDNYLSLKFNERIKIKKQAELNEQSNEDENLLISLRKLFIKASIPYSTNDQNAIYFPIQIRNKFSHNHNHFSKQSNLEILSDFESFKRQAETGPLPVRNKTSPSLMSEFLSWLISKAGLKSVWFKSIYAGLLGRRAKFSELKRTRDLGKFRLRDQFYDELNGEQLKLDQPCCFNYKLCCGQAKVIMWILLIWLIALHYTLQHNYTSAYEDKFCALPPKSNATNLGHQRPSKGPERPLAPIREVALIGGARLRRAAPPGGLSLPVPWEAVAERAPGGQRLAGPLAQRNLLGGAKSFSEHARRSPDQLTGSGKVKSKLMEADVDDKIALEWPATITRSPLSSSGGPRMVGWPSAAASVSRVAKPLFGIDGNGFNLGPRNQLSVNSAAGNNGGSNKEIRAAFATNSSAGYEFRSAEAALQDNSVALNRTAGHGPPGKRADRNHRNGYQLRNNGPRRAGGEFKADELLEEGPKNSARPGGRALEPVQASKWFTRDADESNQVTNLRATRSSLDAPASRPFDMQSAKGQRRRRMARANHLIENGSPPPPSSGINFKQLMNITESMQMGPLENKSHGGAPELSHLKLNLNLETFLAQRSADGRTKNIDREKPEQLGVPLTLQTSEDKVSPAMRAAALLASDPAGNPVSNAKKSLHLLQDAVDDVGSARANSVIGNQFKFSWLTQFVCIIILPTLSSAILFVCAYLRMKEFKLRQSKPMPTIVSYLSSMDSHCPQPISTTTNNSPGPLWAEKFPAGPEADNNGLVSTRGAFEAKNNLLAPEVAKLRNIQEGGETGSRVDGDFQLARASERSISQPSSSAAAALGAASDLDARLHRFGGKPPGAQSPLPRDSIGSVASHNLLQPIGRQLERGERPRFGQNRLLSPILTFNQNSNHSIGGHASDSPSASAGQLLNKSTFFNSPSNLADFGLGAGPPFGIQANQNESNINQAASLFQRDTSFSAPPSATLQPNRFGSAPNENNFIPSAFIATHVNGNHHNQPDLFDEAPAVAGGPSGSEAASLGHAAMNGVDLLKRYEFKRQQFQTRSLNYGYQNHYSASAAPRSDRRTASSSVSPVHRAPMAEILGSFEVVERRRQFLDPTDFEGAPPAEQWASSTGSRHRSLPYRIKRATNDLKGPESKLLKPNELLNEALASVIKSSMDEADCCSEKLAASKVDENRMSSLAPHENSLATSPGVKQRQLIEANSNMGKKLIIDNKAAGQTSAKIKPIERPKQACLLIYSYMTEDQLLRSNMIAFVCNSLLWLPLVVMIILRSKNKSVELTQEFKDSVWWFAVLNCCSCSYIYAITNKDFREAFNKLFYYCCCKSHVTFPKKTPIFRRQIELDAEGTLSTHIIPGLNLHSNRLIKSSTSGLNFDLHPQQSSQVSTQANLIQSGQHHLPNAALSAFGNSLTMQQTGHYANDKLLTKTSLYPQYNISQDHHQSQHQQSSARRTKFNSRSFQGGGANCVPRPSLSGRQLDHQAV